MPLSPAVTIILPTYNRPQYLPDAVKSIMEQKMTDWELLVINDGGCQVEDIISQFNDPRIIYLDQEENRGKAACCNIGLKQARGKYIAYLDDDDKWYPNHLEALSAALENNPETGLVYSDLMEVTFYYDPDRKIRIPISKKISHSYPFDRDLFLLVMNTMHVSLMHRKDLALKAGGYNESLRIMIDRNISLKLLFYSDFLHIREITGEYWLTITESDRISDLGREDSDQYLQTMRRIKGDLPPKPWKNIETVCFIFPVFAWDGVTRKKIDNIMDRIYYPCEFNLVDLSNEGPPADVHEAYPNVKVIPAGDQMDFLSAYLLGAEGTECEYLYLAAASFDDKVQSRIIKFLDYWKYSGGPVSDAIKINSTQEHGDQFNFFIKKSTFLRKCASQAKPAFDIEVISADHTPESCHIFGFLIGLKQAMSEGSFRQVDEMLDVMDDYILNDPDPIATVGYTARHYLYLEKYASLEKVSRKWVENGYGGNAEIYLGRALYGLGRYVEAAECISRGLKEILPDMTILDGVKFPVATAANSLTNGLIWLGDCLVELGAYKEATNSYGLAGRLNP